MLREGSVAGRLSNNTFLRRVERALRARRSDELAGLLSDLPPVPDESGPGRVAKAWPRAHRPAPGRPVPRGLAFTGRSHSFLPGEIGVNPHGRESGKRWQ